MQLTYFIDFASDIPVDKLAFEGNNPDAIHYYIDAGGPKVTMFVDYQRLIKLKAARRDHGPNTLTWSKAPVFHE